MQPQRPPSPEAQRWTQFILWAALVASVVIYLVVTQIVQAPNAVPDSTLETWLLAAAVVLVAVSIPVKNRFQTPEGETPNPAGELVGYLLAIVLCEAAAVFGVVVHFLTGSPRAWVYMAIGLVGLFLHRPKLPPRG